MDDEKVTPQINMSSIFQYAAFSLIINRASLDKTKQILYHIDIMFKKLSIFFTKSKFYFYPPLSLKLFVRTFSKHSAYNASSVPKT